MMLESRKTVLIVTDVQGKLAQLMYEKESLFQNLGRIIDGAVALEIPILRLEQNPAGLGPTLPEIAKRMPGVEPIPKRCFSCCDHGPIMEALKATGRRQILLTGIETHICIYQSAVALIDRGYHVEIVADAVSSRTAANKKIGLEKSRRRGAEITSVETALFELVRVAEGEPFKKILEIVK